MTEEKRLVTARVTEIDASYVTPDTLIGRILAAVAAAQALGFTDLVIENEQEPEPFSMDFRTVMSLNGKRLETDEEYNKIAGKTSVLINKKLDDEIKKKD